MFCRKFSKGKGACPVFEMRSMPDTVSSKSKSRKTTFSSLAIGFVACVIFPGFVTAIAPVSWIRFERAGDFVSATTQTCVFFVIPYKTQHVSPVIGIGDHFIAGTLSSRRPGQSERDRTRSEDEAFLEIHGEETSAEISVSPVNIKSVVERSESFLKDPSAKELRLTVIANWKFGLFAGGFVSLLTLLYVAGLVGLLFQSLWKLAKFSVVPAGE